MIISETSFRIVQSYRLAKPIDEYRVLPTVDTNGWSPIVEYGLVNPVDTMTFICFNTRNLLTLVQFLQNKEDLLVEFLNWLSTQDFNNQKRYHWIGAEKRQRGICCPPVRHLHFGTTHCIRPSGNILDSQPVQERTVLQSLCASCSKYQATIKDVEVKSNDCVDKCICESKVDYAQCSDMEVRESESTTAQTPLTTTNERIVG
uniref:O-phosphoseryl-tRNA(Sec) selenium transferase (inferred by orthology to a human protein) n=1 Tax=Strongyloides venezuelensis TaxID=75913 RepID=A0A0K0F0W8_STRVS